MTEVEFTCPKCGEEAFADVPAGGARIECPSCGARVRVTPPEAGTENRERKDRPRGKKRKQPASTAIPAWAWAFGGMVVMLMVVAVALVLTLGRDKPNDEQVAVADANPVVQAPANPKPVGPPEVGPDTEVLPPKQDSEPVVPPKVEIPKVVEPAKPEPLPAELKGLQPPREDRYRTVLHRIESPAIAPYKVDTPLQPGDDIDQGWPVLPPRKRKLQPADAPNRTTVRWYASRDGGSPLVVLDLPTEPYPPEPGQHRGLLARELARQSLLVAAREEFGARTRDSALRELPPELAGYEPTGTFELEWLVLPGKSAKAALLAVAGKNKRPVWNLEIPLTNADVLDYSRLASALEEAARGSLADTLAKETKSARSPLKTSSGATPPGPEAGLKAVNYFELFAAVRELHRLDQSEGESPNLVTDLARGYAALGLLTEHLDIVTHKAFKARALLYAHRAIARDAPTGRWALAFASCLAGLHQPALEQAKSAGNPVPGWAKVVEPACRHDIDALKALPYEEVGALADVLRFIATENKWTSSQPIAIGLDVLRLNQDCFRVYDGIITIGGLGIIRPLTEAAPALLAKTLADRLGKYAELPPAAVAILGQVGGLDPAAEQTLLRAMDDDTRGEPSLGSLASLIREERFQQMEERVHVYDRYLDLPRLAEEATRQALPFLVDHPLLRVKAARFQPKAVDAARAAAAPLPKSELQLRGWGWIGDDPSLYGSFSHRGAELAHADDVEYDLRIRDPLVQPDDRAAYRDLFLRVSPHSPHARFLLVREDWAKAQEEAKAWEKEFADHGNLLAVLAQKYEETARPNDTERLWRAAAKVAPENRCFFALVNLYTKMKRDESRILAVMEERLKYPDFGLEHARMQVRIAEIYGRHKNYKKALEYAERAAEGSFAEWAIVAASRYAGLAGDRNKALMWEQRRRERYGGGLPGP